MLPPTTATTYNFLQQEKKPKTKIAARVSSAPVLPLDRCEIFIFKVCTQSKHVCSSRFFLFYETRL